MFGKIYEFSDTIPCCFSETGNTRQVFGNIRKHQDPAATCPIFFVIATVSEFSAHLVEDILINVISTIPRVSSRIFIKHVKLMASPSPSTDGVLQ